MAKGPKGQKRGADVIGNARIMKRTKDTENAPAAIAIKLRLSMGSKPFEPFPALLQPRSSAR
jgi:hypothetical protein